MNGLVALLAAATLAAGCTSASEALRTEVSSTPTMSTGTIAGIVYADPSCPVESADLPCLKRPVSGVDVLILRGTTEVASGVTDQNGRFRLDSPTGRVVVIAQNDWAIGSESRALVDVTADHTTRVVLALDTGIR